jgi:hypothetical protein
MQHGQTPMIEIPCLIRVQSVAKPWLRPQVAMVLRGCFEICHHRAPELNFANAKSLESLKIAEESLRNLWRGSRESLVLTDRKIDDRKMSSLRRSTRERPCCIPVVNLRKEATDETRIEHGQTAMIENPCLIRVQSVAKPWLRPQVKMVLRGCFEICHVN